MKNILLYGPRFFKEAFFNIRYYRAVKSIQPELEETGLRIDWIGRIYTVINLKEELYNQPELVQQSYVFQQLSPISQTLMRYDLSNDSFPEITRIDPYSYLVVLYPENDHFNWISFIRNALFAGCVYAVGYAIYSAILNFI